MAFQISVTSNALGKLGNFVMETVCILSIFSYLPTSGNIISEIKLAYQ